MKAVSGLEDARDNYTKKIKFMGTGVKGSGPFWAGLPHEPDSHPPLAPDYGSHNLCCLVLNPFYDIKGTMRHCVLQLV